MASTETAQTLSDTDSNKTILRGLGYNYLLGYYCRSESEVKFPQHECRQQYKPDCDYNLSLHQILI